jgi:hypothetical protein
MKGLFDDIDMIQGAPAAQPAGGYDLFSDVPPLVDLNKPMDETRAAIAALPEAERPAALRAWADQWVKADRQGGVIQSATDIVRQTTRGTPVGSFLDEANALTASAQHKLGLGGAPYEEAVAYQRALDRAVDTDTGGTGTALKIAGGIASAPVSPIAQVSRVPGAMGAAINVGVSGAGYGAAYGLGEGETTGERLQNAAIGGGLGLAIGAPAGAAIHKGVEVLRRGRPAPVAAEIQPAPAAATPAAVIPEAPPAQLALDDMAEAARPTRDTFGGLIGDAPPAPAPSPVTAPIPRPTRETFGGLIAEQPLPPGSEPIPVAAPVAAVEPRAPVNVTVAASDDAATMRVVTPDQSMEVTASPQIVELADLKAAGGKFQPRDRSRTEYVTEAKARAARLDPEQLKPGRVSDSGAPIVLEDGTIISGNGRTISIAEAYRNPAFKAQADNYRASLGPAAAGMREPVLVMRAEQMTDETAAKFADLSNRGRIAAMSATERAQRDATAIGEDLVALYKGGDFEAPDNLNFLRAFTSKAVTDGERAAFSKDGRVTQEGITRMKNAVLAGAYDDAPLLSRLVESSDDNVRNITGALMDAAPGFARLRADIKLGLVPEEMDATRSLMDAAKLIADLRSRRISPATFFAQQDAFDAADPLMEQWVRAFYNPELSRPISRQKMADVLNAYAEEAGKKQVGGLFEDPTTKGDVLNVAKRAGIELGTDTPAESGGGLFEGLGSGFRASGEPAQRSSAQGGSAATQQGREISDASAKLTGRAAQLEKIEKQIDAKKDERLNGRKRAVEKQRKELQDQKQAEWVRRKARQAAEGAR